MRTIKFRGKQIHNGEWAYGDLYQNRGDGKIYMAGNSSETMGGITHTLWDVDPETVGQFTGMFDRDGKEIYEGDLYTNEDKKGTYEVAFSNGAFTGGTHAAEKDPIPFGWEYEKPIDSDWIIVTGNMHDHES